VISTALDKQYPFLSKRILAEALRFLEIIDQQKTGTTDGLYNIGQIASKLNMRQVSLRMDFVEYISAIHSPGGQRMLRRDWADCKGNAKRKPIILSK
jgi:hypothetical protein